MSDLPSLPKKGAAKDVPFIRIVREGVAAPAPIRVRDPGDIAKLLDYLKQEEVEVFVVVMLDSQSKVRGVATISRGLVNSTLVHPREVFRAAIAFGATGIILAHNHPSGDPTPSPEDRAATRQLVEAGRMLDLPVYDHVIVAGERFLSFVSAGLL